MEPSLVLCAVQMSHLTMSLSEMLPGTQEQAHQVCIDIINIHTSNRGVDFQIGEYYAYIWDYRMRTNGPTYCSFCFGNFELLLLYYQVMKYSLNCKL